MFKDTDNTERVLRVLRVQDGKRAIAGIFSPGREEQAEKLGYQEFGTTAPGSVQRQTVAPAFDAHEDTVVRGLARDLSDALENKLAPGDVAENTAKTLAVNIRERLESNTGDSLAPSTLAARRRRGNNGTDTLIDTRDMFDAIEHDVREGEDASG